VAYQRILQLSYVEDLLNALKTLFIKLFEPFLATFIASLHVVNQKKDAIGEAVMSWDFVKAFEGWDKIFDKLLKGLEDKAAQVR
jgi:signal recognition particle receptor subunit alpha